MALGRWIKERYRIWKVLFFGSAISCIFGVFYGGCFGLRRNSSVLWQRQREAESWNVKAAIMENKYFNQALSDFVNDVAYGGAVRHMADLGYTVRQIVDALDFPAPTARVGAIVWRRYLEQGIILLERPEQSPAVRKVSYVKEYGKYGSVHFRQVVEEVECTNKEYYPCDFGRKRYQDGGAFQKELECLEDEIGRAHV